MLIHISKQFICCFKWFLKYFQFSAISEDLQLFIAHKENFPLKISFLYQNMNSYRKVIQRIESVFLTHIMCQFSFLHFLCTFWFLAKRITSFFAKSIYPYTFLPRGFCKQYFCSQNQHIRNSTLPSNFTLFIYTRKEKKFLFIHFCLFFKGNLL